MKLIGTVVNTLLVVLILSVVAFLVAPRFGFMNPYEIKIVRSGSMEPAIKTGSVVVIHPASTYAVGDVITFGKDTRTAIPTTHRITAVTHENNTTYLSTKGDANEDPDATLTPLSSVIGKVVFTVPVVGYIFAFAKTKLGFTMLIGIPAALIMLYEAIGIYTELKALKRRKKNERAIAEIAHEAREVSRGSLLPERLAPTAEQSYPLHFDIETPHKAPRYHTI